VYLENIYSINQKLNQTLEIDKPLYDILHTSLEYQTLTQGAFDITLGKISRIWKDVIESAPKTLEVGNYLFLHSYDGSEVSQRFEIMSFTSTEVTLQHEDNVVSYEKSKMVYDLEAKKVDIELANTRVENLDISESEIVLSNQNGRYYVQLKGEHAQLDLGAISKGYTTEIVRQYLSDEGVEYFSISAGSSTIALGKNMNRPNEDYIFNVALTDPKTSKALFKPTYGIIKVKDTSVTTSGNFEQYTVYEGTRYHHLISPFTKKPATFYEALTVVGNNAGLSDALSTALFVMDIETFENFMEQNKDSLGIEVIRYNQDNSLSTFINTLIFEDKR
jgi:FAD:protein FMN transferase